MPLGGLADFPYRQSELDLDPGDTVLLDERRLPGAAQRRRRDVRLRQGPAAFARVAATAPQTIIDRLVADGDAWAGGKPAADDTTFVVLKMRDGAGPRRRGPDPSEPGDVEADADLPRYGSISTSTNSTTSQHLLFTLAGRLHIGPQWLWLVQPALVADFAR